MIADYITNFLPIIKPIIEIFTIAYVFYKFYVAISNTKAEQMIRLILTALAIFAISYLLKLDTLIWLLQKAFIPFILFLVIIYQQEIRRAFTPLWGNRKGIFNIGEISLPEQIDIILNACEVLVNSKRGALIVLPRNIAIKSIIESGTKINADLSQSLIVTVFGHDTPLHDGAMIISGSKIIAAGCYLPLSDQPTISKSFGTRHKAALGLSEESDAIVIVVSEEKGTITICHNSNLYYKLDRDTLKRKLLMLFNTTENPDEEVEIRDEVI